MYIHVYIDITINSYACVIDLNLYNILIMPLPYACWNNYCKLARIKT